MRKATLSDKALVIDLLCRAFDDNQSVNYIIPQDKNRSQRIDALMDYSFEVCSLFGEVFLDNDDKACALVLYPYKKKTTFKAVLLDLKLILKAVSLGGIGRALKRDAKIKSLRPIEPMTYLWFIGVNPLDQQQGKGGKLLMELIAYSNKQNLPIYLETSTLRNLPWYKNFGFEIYNQLDLGYELFFLKYLPVKV